ncbi:MAG: hypothetical protein AAB568_00260 [Patescibacteria group bacterium]
MKKTLAIVWGLVVFQIVCLVTVLWCPSLWHLDGVDFNTMVTVAVSLICLIAVGLTLAITTTLGLVEEKRMNERWKILSRRIY